MKEKTEKAKSDIEQSKLDFVTEGKQIPTGSSEGSGFDIENNLQLLAKFNKKYSNIFFCMFEWPVDSRVWFDGEQTLLLQYVLTCKAQL